VTLKTLNFDAGVIVVFVELEIFPSTHEDPVFFEQRGRVDIAWNIDCLYLLKCVGIAKGDGFAMGYRDGLSVPAEFHAPNGGAEIGLDDFLSRSGVPQPERLVVAGTDELVVVGRKQDLFESGGVTFKDDLGLATFAVAASFQVEDAKLLVVGSGRQVSGVRGKVDRLDDVVVGQGGLRRR